MTRATCSACGAVYDADSVDAVVRDEPGHPCMDPYEDVLDLCPGDEVPAGRCTAMLKGEEFPCGMSCYLDPEPDPAIELLKRIEWTASPSSTDQDPELFCPGCEATCDVLDRHDFDCGECRHCGEGPDDDAPAGICHGPEGSCPRKHVDGCPLAALLEGKR